MPGYAGQENQENPETPIFKKNEKIRSTGDLNCKTTETMALGACAATSEENGAPATSDEPAKL